MPSNIFANTGTSVSIVFIDKAKQDDKVMLMDASGLGEKVSLEDGQRTVLNFKEINKIMSFFKSRIEEPEFSVLVLKDVIKENGYSFQAGQYVSLKELNKDLDIEGEISNLKSTIINELIKNKKLADDILNMFNEV